MRGRLKGKQLMSFEVGEIFALSFEVSFATETRK